MNILYNKYCLILLSTFLAFFGSLVLQAQEPDVNAFVEALAENQRENERDGGDSAEGYKSFVQNEF